MLKRRKIQLLIALSFAISLGISISLVAEVNLRTLFPFKSKPSRDIIEKPVH